MHNPILNDVLETHAQAPLDRWQSSTTITQHTSPRPTFAQEGGECLVSNSVPGARLNSASSTILQGVSEDSGGW